jgi:hypothetical protein
MAGKYLNAVGRRPLTTVCSRRWLSLASGSAVNGFVHSRQFTGCTPASPNHGENDKRYQREKAICHWPRTEQAEAGGRMRMVVFGVGERMGSRELRKWIWADGFGPQPKERDVASPPN